MNTLRDRMMQDLKLAGHALKTQKAYLECMGFLRSFVGRRPEGHSRRKGKTTNDN